MAGYELVGDRTGCYRFMTIGQEEEKTTHDYANIAAYTTGGYSRNYSRQVTPKLESESHD